MAVNNSLTATSNKPAPFSAVISSEGYKKLINNTLRDPKQANRFVASITSVVSTNPALQTCEPASIVSAALLGESLNLAPSPQLGQYYMVPFKMKAKIGRNGETLSPERTVAQFQLGYKGYIQLAIRSGYYKKINVLAIKEGELVRFNPLEEEITVNLIEDDNERDARPTCGYYAMFEYHNGFKKAMYWSKEKMVAHADKYSQAFSKDATAGKYPKVSFADFEAGKVDEKDMWKYSSFWYKDFDGMAYKTMLRQLISKWGIMSIDMQKAMDGDMGAINEDGTVDYIDNTPAEPMAGNGNADVIDVDPETGEVVGGAPSAEDDPTAGFFD